MLPSVLAFFFIIIDDGSGGYRVAPSTVGYVTLEECKEGQQNYRTMEETGAFSECFAIEKGGYL